MTFNSLIFLLVFLPVTLIGYYFLLIIKKTAISKVWLIGMSLWFYGYYNPSYLLIICSSVLFNYLICRLLIGNVKYKKLLVTVGVLANLMLLFVFKYMDFFIENVNSIFGSDYMLTNIILPLGISFFTFQQIAFVVDAGRGEAKDYSFVDYALFVTFFAQLVAGPIVSHKDMIPQFRDESKKKFDSDNFFRGCLAFSLGLCKKVIIADTFAKAVDWGYLSIDYLNSLTAALVALAYIIQLYFDFSGYSDMAYGLGLMLNFDIAMNFNSPYKAWNIVDFWHRWHITLSNFFTHYVYFPLGGSRKGKVRKYINYAIVFLVSGFWHGADWSFVVWGLLHGFAYILVRIVLDIAKEHSFSIKNRVVSAILKAFGVVINMIFLAYVFIYFRAADVMEARSIINVIKEGAFVPGDILNSFADCFNVEIVKYGFKILGLSGYAITNYIMCLLFFMATFIILYFSKNVREIVEKAEPKIVTAVVMAVLVLVCMVSYTGVETFIYYNF